MMRLQQTFALPDGRHVPGVNPRPEGGPVAAAAAAARQGFEPAEWAASAAYLYGFDLLAGGFFWEAHEVWEPAWMRCRPNSRERVVLQALIQCANACLKDAMGRPAAARRLLRLAAALFDEVPGEGAVLGVEAARTAAALRELGAGAGDGETGFRPDLSAKCIIMQQQGAALPDIGSLGAQEKNDP